jgi:hypothetical protein
VRYPLPAAVQLVRACHRDWPLPLLMGGLRIYLGLLKLRHWSAVIRAGVDEHFQTHKSEQDRRAILSRYEIILQNDPRPLARRLSLPLYYITGFWDVIVMWFLVQPWLKTHCPAYRGWRLVWSAEHNVLGFQPRISAQQIMQWLAAD